MRVLGIETSCDETGVAVYSAQHGLLAHRLYSQVDLHLKYGGVVPELASRDHVRKLIPLIDATLVAAGCRGDDIDGIAYTAGPGLVGALLVGAAVARSLAWAWGKPAIAVHHMEGHLLAPLLEVETPDFPFVALLVSGGHTMLVEVRGVGQYQILGESVDDAAGEAFDKTAKLLGLSYPGGPALAALAEQGRVGRFQFPRPMTHRPNLDFSFSGLKTFALNTYNQSSKSEQDKADIACAFQQAVVETLSTKCRRALQQTGLKRLVVAGGVSANRALRQQLELDVKVIGGAVYFPRQAFCTDNGAMIALAGCLRLKAGQSEPLGFNVNARWSLESLAPLKCN